MASCKAQLNSLAVPEGRTPGTLAESAGLPAGFPKTVDSPLAWAGSEYTDESKYCLVLTQHDRKEAEAALEAFKGLCGRTS